MGSESEVDRSLWAANVGRPEEEDVPRRQEDLAVESWVGGGATDFEELDLKEGEQSPGSVGTPGHC